MAQLARSVDRMTAKLGLSMSDAATKHSSPLLVSDGVATALTRVGQGPTSSADALHKEAFIQQLVNDHPAVIPMLDIEPAFTPLIAVCREMETPAGFLDNLWITPDGGIVLGECKLVRNPQARREVVAQALDYARAMTSWRYEDLESAARKAVKNPDFSIYNLVAELSDLDEAEFHDSVERRLRFGRLMVLIIGDGIQEGAEALTSYLQMHAGIHAGLALVDLSIWQLKDGARLVVPRIPMRTVLVERGVVTVDENGRATVSAPGHASPAQTASEAEFIEQLRARRPELVSGLKEFIAALPDAGITPEFRRSLVLRWMPSPDQPASAGYVDSYGSAYLSDAYGAAKKLGRADIGEKYLQAVAAAVGGSVKLMEKHNPAVLGPSGRTVHLAELLPVREAWLAAINSFISDLSAAAAQENAGVEPA
jgi:hypothetical protein